MSPAPAIGTGDRRLTAVAARPGALGAHQGEPGSVGRRNADHSS